MPADRGLVAVGIAAGVIGAAVLADRLIGVHIVSVTYAAGPNAHQATATVTIRNDTSSQSTYTLVGYDAAASDVAAYAPLPLGLPIETPAARYAKLYAAQRIAGHWFSNPGIVASGAGATDPTAANAARAIPVTVARGQQVQVKAYSATPFSSAGGLYGIWFLFPGSGVLAGNPAASWFDRSPMPAIS